ncbi:hypothetical protein ILUMI_05856 [Ignelater luminosus]|uniref:Uncharacterized protein n=1 Tax=Ignelater luminosus TaxID=2038154 RepID=A0A8K0DBU2_IGNLU|nr:hypothetical protein ILUMI_05856 [Ignelater luminosus]
MLPVSGMESSSSLCWDIPVLFTSIGYYVRWIDEKVLSDVDSSSWYSEMYNFLIRNKIPYTVEFNIFTLIEDVNTSQSVPYGYFGLISSDINFIVTI